MANLKIFRMKHGCLLADLAAEDKRNYSEHWKDEFNVAISFDAHCFCIIILFANFIAVSLRFGLTFFFLTTL